MIKHPLANGEETDADRMIKLRTQNEDLQFQLYYGKDLEDSEWKRQFEVALFACQIVLGFVSERLPVFCCSKQKNSSGSSRR